MNDNPPELSLLETRILGTLVEKQRTVPDTYPLSVNALQAGCNQKTSRNPVMETTEAEILVALDDLKEKGWVREVSGSRVSRFEHQVEKVLGVPTQASALLTFQFNKAAIQRLVTAANDAVMAEFREAA
jgi:uncharacterized protein YceH (UPF0502 family)